MRLWLTALPASLLLAGSALAQAPTPNAIGLWHSSELINSGIGFNTVPAGTVGLSVWQVLPPDVLTYFRPQGAGALRELDFRGLEFKMFRTGTPIGLSEIPQIDITRAVQAAAPNEGRYVPDAAVLASFPAAPWTFPTGVVVQLQYVNVAPVAVPAGTSAGQGLAARYVDYCKTGGAGQKVILAYTFAESNGPALNGLNGGAGDIFMDAAGFPASETTTSFLFDQSMVQPIKNSTLSSGGSPLLGGGSVPAGVFNFVSDDGRGGLKPSGGQTLSYLVNSNKGANPAFGSVWVLPFVMLEGDTQFGTNPAPENWVGNGASVENAYIHSMSWRKWVQDLLFAGLGVPPAGGMAIATALNPNDSTLGLWLGIDLPAFQNLVLLVNSFLFASTANGPAWAGPETTMFDSLLAPTAPIGRNLVNLGTKIAENKHWNVPQTGWTAAMGFFPPLMGFGVNPGGASVAGVGFYVTAWVFDVSSPTNPTGVEMIDMTNVAKFTLQP